MSKEGVIKCQDCDAEFVGLLPDHRNIDYRYSSAHGEIDQDLVDRLQEHHANTAVFKGTSGRKMFGHPSFDVFLNGGGIGNLRVSSYYVEYRELPKEEADLFVKQ